MRNRRTHTILYIQSLTIKKDIIMFDRVIEFKKLNYLALLNVEGKAICWAPFSTLIQIKSKLSPSKLAPNE